MIARTVLRLVLSLALFAGFAVRLAPAISADRGLSCRVGLLLAVFGALWSGLRLFASRWIDGRNARAESFWGYAAPPWAQDLIGVLFIFAGAALLAWGMA